MNFAKNNTISFFILLVISISIACSGGGSTGPDKPRITEGPTLENAQFETAQITWRTNVNTNSIVRYGTASGQLDDVQRKDNLQTIHEVLLLNLSSNTNYFYIVESQNEQGSATSGEQQFSTLKSLLDFINEAWLDYDNGNFSASIPKFKEAINQSPNGPGIVDAYSGLGWAYVSNPVDSLDKAIENFNGALLRSANYVEALAGRGFANLAQKDYNDAIADLERTIQLSANFVFSHNTEINANDVRLGLAEGYFFRQELDKAQAEVTQLAPDNGLDPGDSGTWVVDQVNYLSYAEALLAWIEKLKSII